MKDTLPESDAQWLDRNALEFYRRPYAQCCPLQHDNLQRALALRSLDLVDCFARSSSQDPSDALRETPPVPEFFADPAEDPGLRPVGKMNAPEVQRVDRPTKTRTLAIETAGDYFRNQVKPKIRLEGQWLARLGFLAGRRVQVVSGAPGELTLRAV